MKLRTILSALLLMMLSTLGFADEESELRGEIATTQGQVDATQAQINTLASQNQNLTTQANQLDTQIAQKNATLSSLNGQLAQKQSELSTKQQALAQRNGVLATDKAKLDKLKADLVKLEGEIAALQMEIAAQKIVLAQKEKERDDLQQQIDTLNDEIATLRSEIVVLEAKIARLKEALALHSGKTTDRIASAVDIYKNIYTAIEDPYCYLKGKEKESDYKKETAADILRAGKKILLQPATDLVGLSLGGSEYLLRSLGKIKITSSVSKNVWLIGNRSVSSITFGLKTNSGVFGSMTMAPAEVILTTFDESIDKIFLMNGERIAAFGVANTAPFSLTGEFTFMADSPFLLSKDAIGARWIGLDQSGHNQEVAFESAGKHADKRVLKIVNYTASPREVEVRSPKSDFSQHHRIPARTELFVSTHPNFKSFDLFSGGTKIQSLSVGQEEHVPLDGLSSFKLRHPLDLLQASGAFQFRCLYAQYNAEEAGLELVSMGVITSGKNEVRPVWRISNKTRLPQTVNFGAVGTNLNSAHRQVLTIARNADLYVLGRKTANKSSHEIILADSSKISAPAKQLGFSMSSWLPYQAFGDHIAARGIRYKRPLFLENGATNETDVRIKATGTAGDFDTWILTNSRPTRTTLSVKSAESEDYQEISLEPFTELVLPLPTSLNQTLLVKSGGKELQISADQSRSFIDRSLYEPKELN